jgi:hypothetical protein
MLVSIPVDGGHHVVDVLAGVLLTVVSVLAARHIVALAEQRAPRESPFAMLTGRGLWRSRASGTR